MLVFANSTTTTQSPLCASLLHTNCAFIAELPTFRPSRHKRFSPFKFIGFILSFEKSVVNYLTNLWMVISCFHKERYEIFIYHFSVSCKSNSRHAFLPPLFSILEFLTVMVSADTLSLKGFFGAPTFFLAIFVAFNYSTIIIKK